MNMNPGNMMNDQMMNNQMNMNPGNMMNDQMNQIMNQMMNNQNNQMNQIAAMMQNIQNNLANNNNTQNNNTSQNQQNYGFLNIYFRTGEDTGTKGIEIQCTLDEKVSDVIQRYRAKTGDTDPLKKFIFNAKMLNQDLTLEKAGLTNGANIFVVATKGIKGAY